MQHDDQREPISQPDFTAQEGLGVEEYRLFVEHVFHEVSQPVSALWCALEVAAMRPPDPEEDRQDLLAAFAVVEELGKKVRSLQNEADARSRRARP